MGTFVYNAAGFWESASGSIAGALCAFTHSKFVETQRVKWVAHLHKTVLYPIWPEALCGLAGGWRPRRRVTCLQHTRQTHAVADSTGD